MKQIEYLSVIKDMFSPSGALVKAGGRHNAQQQEYASHIAKALSRNSAIALAEANTGIGKSIGYLIPSLVYLATHERCHPIVISTYTRALQRQLLEKDVVLAKAALKEMGFDVPSVAFRMGRQAFFSPTRVHDAVDRLKEGVAGKEHAQLVDFAQRSVMTGSGLWLDYLSMYGSFPEGISSDDVCMLDLMESDNPAYDEHLLRSKNARLLITNHATVMNRQVFKNAILHAVICDEAHEIEGVCIDLSTYRSQLKRIGSALAATSSKSKATTNGINLASKLEAQLVEFDCLHNKSQNLISDINSDAFMNSLQPDVVTLQKSLVDCRKRYVKSLGETLSIAEARVVERLDRHIETLRSFERGTDRSKRRAIAFSPTLREPSIAAISLSAGRLFSYHVNKMTKRIVLVSATMSNANTKTLSFSHIIGSLGINEEDVTDTCSISPSNFGKMQFVVVPSGKSPVLSNSDNEYGELCEKWLGDMARMIDAAAKTGKTLVLSPSIKESKLLAKRIKSDYLLQDENNPLMQLTDAFISNNEPVLLSAGAWNGVSFRNSEGGQLLKNIVITRIPFIPPDEEQVYLESEWMLSRGYTPQTIKGIQWTQTQYNAMVKLKQGIGRGLRAPTDDIKVWFGDPRMPTAKKSSGLIAAIPQRFLENYYKAEVFDGELIQEAEPIFYL